MINPGGALNWSDLDIRRCQLMKMERIGLWIYVNLTHQLNRLNSARNT